MVLGSNLNREGEAGSHDQPVRTQEPLAKPSHSHPVSTGWDRFHESALNRFNGLRKQETETVETVKRLLATFNTRLKPGVNERSFASGSQDYSQFKHDNPQHARLPCLLCHRRETNSPRPSLPGKSNHAPCAGCHTQQFGDSSSPICTICHTNSQAGAVKAFPALKSFNVKFDHASHSSVGATCATCHRPNRRGISLSIPAGLNAHTLCFGCHTPDAKPNERNSLNLGSCSTCHELGRHVWTRERAAAFRLGFSHSSHGASENLRCSACHRVRSEQPIGRQVTSPIALNHHAPARSLSCLTCHNGTRAFGGDDFSVCARCHKGSLWRF
jgi:Cytochrome c7 and related cytochrome c